MPPAVHLRDALALIGSFPALAGVDLDVGRGEVVLVQGPNGAGKTSLLRACAGLLPVSSGEAVVLGHDLLRQPRAVRRRVALVGHATFLYDELTAVDNVRFAVRASGASPAGVDAAMARVGLVGRLRRTRVARLSAGQRRRVALAVLLARRPELWLLDEPHAGLDAGGRDLLDDVVREAVADGVTVLLASHEADRARPLADRAVTMTGGRIEAAPVEVAPVEAAPVEVAEMLVMGQAVRMGGAAARGEEPVHVA
ncbi:MAG: heme ABC exporter ATP-binding protein CcmA [Acidimicrobiales bacterium]